MRNIIIQIIKEIERRKKAERIKPTAPVLAEVQREIRSMYLKEIEEMEKAGIIKTGNTINDKYIKPGRNYREYKEKNKEILK